jgi:hypothetical protein
MDGPGDVAGYNGGGSRFLRVALTGLPTGKPPRLRRWECLAP